MVPSGTILCATSAERDLVYKDIILGIKLNGPNLFSRIEFYFTCYTIYTQFEAHF